MVLTVWSWSLLQFAVVLTSKKQFPLISDDYAIYGDICVSGYADNSSYPTDMHSTSSFTHFYDSVKRRPNLETNSGNKKCGMQDEETASNLLVCSSTSKTPKPRAGFPENYKDEASTSRQKPVSLVNNCFLGVNLSSLSDKSGRQK